MMNTNGENILPIAQFLDAKGRIRQMPAKDKACHAVLGYLSGKFAADRDYTEKEVNAICDEWHTFGDYFLLRRGLVDHAYLCRETDGSRYWRTQPAID